MLTLRERAEKYEDAILAPYAARSADTRGRQYPQERHPIRTAFQRDRDRVIHSAAFRRMDRKTQVFLSDEGDHYRTRLTHTLEVAQISRTIARALGLNEDLAESISLVHDLGHTPFGHSGEAVMDRLMQSFGGFNHNRQSLRVVDIIEHRYKEHQGLNLTYEVREGIVKHETSGPQLFPDIFPPDEKPTLEALIVDQADAIAYNCHDLDDGLSSGIIDWEELADVPFLEEVLDETAHLYPVLDSHLRRHIVVRRLVDIQVSDLMVTAFFNIEQMGFRSLDDVRKAPGKAMVFSERLSQKLRGLKSFLNEKMYRHPRMEENGQRAERVIEALFRSYCGDPNRLYGRYKERLGVDPVEVIVCDFVAGMTDRFALRMFENLAG